jgi:hypothetical protein
MRMRTLICALIALALGAVTPAVRAAGDDSEAARVLASARKAIGDKKLDSLKTLSVEASLQRNLAAMQVASEVEILIELPDKYVRTDTGSGPMSGGMSMGFIGDKPIRPANSGMLAGGGLIIRMGPGGPLPGGETLSPEDRAKADAMVVRSTRAEVSRMMLGWFATAHPAIAARYTYAGDAESPDGKAHVIDAMTDDGFAARLFIDQQANLPLMVTYKAPQPRMVTVGGPRGAGGAAQRGGQREVSEEERKTAREATERQMHDIEKEPPALVEFTLFFDDWRDVGGLKFPHKMRRASAGTTSEEWTVNKVKVNPKIDQKKFEG